jgi:SAM-dependent methyltransferase
MHFTGLEFISPKSVVEGLLTFLPGLKNLLNKKTGGTNSARYCYTVWLRHYVKIFQTLGVNLKGTNIAELGPGDSLGTGIAALLSGCRKYTAIDSIQHFDIHTNLIVLNDIYDLFSRKERIPGPEEFPIIRFVLEDFEFPSFLNDIENTIEKENINKITRALVNPYNPASPISYLPVESAGFYEHDATLDLVFSQAVLEHVDDLPSVYALCRKWLRPGGLMSHNIDFKCHGSSRQWNGHWAYPSWLWRMLLGRRKYFINRQPLSRHLDLLKQNGFSIMLLEKYH